ncbi:hypothetical protein PMZ80_006370 [Knufia obscura]|uniref:Uncharacterized protein n=2 Tax=Knufia TaxID=430999 RepID=A0AAN8EE40_9EURO|nr:hypothetical protein PMZ80_006370 [Knufia obscura]KAK5953484.1 hypothetical protein OHC33_005428 [Knufia fluminis]
MRPSSFCFTFTTTSFFLLCLIRHSSSQIVGCDGNEVECPASNSKVETGACAYKGTQDGIGIVSFESNITSDGPLTWTMFEWDEASPTVPYSQRSFYLGSPPSLSFENITDFGACGLSLASNLSSALQLPSGFNDFSNFGCSTVMGESCPQDLVAQVRSELMLLLNDDSFSGEGVCLEIGQRLQNTPLPDSCVQPLRSDLFYYGNAKTLSSDPKNDASMYQTQDDCSVTTGGPDYNMVVAMMNSVPGEPDSEEVEMFKNGTTPLLTLFYNEPWNNASTGPVSFLEEPEVHLSCLRKVPTAEQQSGSVRLQAGLGIQGWAWLFMGGLLWTIVVS